MRGLVFFCGGLVGAQNDSKHSKVHVKHTSSSIGENRKQTKMASAIRANNNGYQGFAVFPLSKALQRNGLSREVSEDMKRRLVAWLSRQTCVFEAGHHEKYWDYFVQARDDVVPPQFTAEVGEYVPGTVRIVRRFLQDGELRGETMYMPAECMVLVICDMFFGDDDPDSKSNSSDRLPPLRTVMTPGNCEAPPIVIAQAVTFIARIVPDMLKWAVPTYSAINLAGGTSIDVRALDILRRETRPAFNTSGDAHTDRATFVIFARLVFNYVFAEMCASPGGVSEARIRVRLCHEPALFHMFCRRLTRAPRLTSAQVARAVPGMCADAVSQMGLLMLNELLDCAADHTVECYNHLLNEFKTVGSGPNAGRHGSDFAMARRTQGSTGGTAMSIVKLWCSNALMYDIFMRSRDAAHAYVHTNDPLWRALCSDQRSTRVNIGSVRLHTWNTAIALLVQSAHASGLWRVCSFVRKHFEHPSMAIIAQVSGCTQYEFFHTVSRVVPREHTAFWSSFFTQTCVVDLGVIDEDGEGVLIVCSDPVYTLLEAIVLASMVCRPASSADVPRTLEMLQVSYHVTRALEVGRRAPFAGSEAWCEVLWRLVVSWAEAEFMSKQRPEIDWAGMAERVWCFGDDVARAIADKAMPSLEFFQDKNRSKVTVCLLAQATGILAPKFAKRAFRQHTVALAGQLLRDDEQWLRSHGLQAFANAGTGVGAAELVSDIDLIANLLDCVLRHRTHATVGPWIAKYMSQGVCLALCEWLGMERNSTVRMMDDGRIPAVRYGDNVEEQRLQLVCAVPSSVSALRESDSKLLTKYRAVGVDVIRSNQESSSVAARTSLGVLDVLLTWENIFRRPLQPLPNLTGLVPSAVVACEHSTAVQAAAPKWQAFLQRVNYDIPYAVGTNGMCWSRRHLPFVQFMNRKVVFFDDMRAKLMCAAPSQDKSWMSIDGCAEWWDFAHFNTAFDKRFVIPKPIVSKSAPLPTAAASVYSPVYSPASPQYMYSPTSPVVDPYLNIPASYQFVVTDDDDSDDDDGSADGGRDDHDMTEAAMRRFNQHESVVSDALRFNPHGSFMSS